MFPTDISNTKPSSTVHSLRKASEDFGDVKGAGRWTKEEHERFLQGLKKFGKNWKQIEEYVGSRTGSQVRSHAQKFFLKLEKDGEVDLNSLETTSQANDVPQPMRKASAGSNSTNCSHPTTTITGNAVVSSNTTANSQDHAEPAKKLESVPILPPAKINVPLQISTPKLDDVLNFSNLQQRQRRMSIDVFPARTFSNPLFEVFLSKFKQSEAGFQLPKLSDIVDMTSNSRALFAPQLGGPSLETLLALNTLNNKVYSGMPLVVPARKFSEDNILIQNRGPQLPQILQHSQYNISPEFEQLAKKLKKV